VTVTGRKLTIVIKKKKIGKGRIKVTQCYAHM